jgi:shikimate dehydrogenase
MSGRAEISASTRLGAVLGWPVEHSLSPALQGAALRAAQLDAVFLALAVRPEALGDAVRGLAAMGALGASVTVPHKQAVMAHCDRLDSLAERIGAVNCLAFEAGEVVGYNTDAEGFADSLCEELRICLRGLRPVILGSGGAARAVAAGLEAQGSEPAVVIARSPERARWARKVRPWTRRGAEGVLSRCDLLVDATSIGLDADRDREAELWPLEPLSDQAAVATLIYHRDTALLREARQRGHRTFGGAGMLVHQGARAFHIWTGMEPPLEAMWAAMRDAVGGTGA